MPQPASGSNANGNGVEEGGGNASSTGGGGKTKDLSHVPCKFFRVGGCTAGAACPFSHTTGPGERGEKDVCAWFVKGTCKFGHKCALAHVLPGQSPSMDRRNKKAAQMASGKGGKESNKGRGREGERDGDGAERNPSAPAPALKDADFSSFGAMAEKEEKKDEPKSWASVAAATKKQEQPEPKPVEAEETPSGTLPMSTPRPPLSPSKPPVDFGPIGSPPRSWGSSLSDLLTADELARRVSKSVPAPSLLAATQSPPSSATRASGPHLPPLPTLDSPPVTLRGPSSADTHTTPPPPASPLHTRRSTLKYTEDRGAAMGVSLPQGLAAGYSRIHARPGSEGAWGAAGKTREWGASSYGTGAGSFGGSPLSASFFGQRPPPGSSYKAAVSFKDRPVFGVLADMPPPGLQQQHPAPSFNAGRDRFADRAAGIPERTVEDDDLFVLDG
ncbi:hypothetical protein CPB85DRAFT_1431066 [Mucidula mucida]|nr:hypothetical protein CPB85DRAFT_1431066 [Mucidula mucida]